MATLTSLADRLRGEIGDMPRSFVYSARGDGTTKRFDIKRAPAQGSTLVVKVNGTALTDNVGIEEQTGTLIFDTAPANNAQIEVSGIHFRYFTDAEAEQFIKTAFLEHSSGMTTSAGSHILQMDQLPPINEYPIVILASTMALYALATDASFDIDITAPDGVHIPRSERYRQLTDMIASRKEQYRELCTMLGIGMYAVEIFTLRRISRMTNRYVPIYRPMEIEDRSYPVRVRLPLPNYGDVPRDTEALDGEDLTLIAGDEFDFQIDFDFDISDYAAEAQVRLFPAPPGDQVGSVLLAQFAITVSQSTESTFPNSLTLALSGTSTENFPPTAYYDVQLTDAQGNSKTYVRGKVLTEPQVTQ